MSNVSLSDLNILRPVTCMQAASTSRGERHSPMSVPQLAHLHRCVTSLVPGLPVKSAHDNRPLRFLSGRTFCFLTLTTLRLHTRPPPVHIFDTLCPHLLPINNKNTRKPDITAQVCMYMLHIHNRRDTPTNLTPAWLQPSTPRTPSPTANASSWPSPGSASARSQR
jgi:hypothetical protein